MGQEADKLRQNGWLVVGGGKLNDSLELDRSFGFKVMENFGIRTPRSYAFPNFSDAGKFVLSHRRPLVFKPDRNLQTNYTFVTQSNDELLNFISHLKTVRKVDGPCVLQEFVKGTEVSTEIWYAQGSPLAFPNSTIEVKKFLPQDLGVSTGSMGSIVWPYPVRQPRLVQKSLKKIGILLEKKNYTGPLDINGIVSKGKFYGLEFSARFGYNPLHIKISRGVVSRFVNLRIVGFEGVRRDGAAKGAPKTFVEDEGLSASGGESVEHSSEVFVEQREESVEGVVSKSRREFEAIEFSFRYDPVDV
ncbi:hypothetical protein ACFL3Q_11890 [Planctomycetota bacterium]